MLRFSAFYIGLVMTRAVSLATLSILGLALAACAPTGAKEGQITTSSTGQRCAFAEMVQGYTVDKDTLYLRAGSRVIQVEAASYCPSLDTGYSLGFRPQRGSSQVCVGDWIDVMASGSSIASGPCRAQVSKLMSPEEVAALPEKLRPR